MYFILSLQSVSWDVADNVSHACRLDPTMELQGPRSNFWIEGAEPPNAELPMGQETGWGSEFTGLRQQQ